jgi:hypothetical protein
MSQKCHYSYFSGRRLTSFKHCGYSLTCFSYLPDLLMTRKRHIIIWQQIKFQFLIEQYRDRRRRDQQAVVLLPGQAAHCLQNADLRGER